MNLQRMPIITYSIFTSVFSGTTVDFDTKLQCILVCCPLNFGSVHSWSLRNMLQSQSSAHLLCSEYADGLDISQYPINY